ncbi:MAG TPA: hypothetical protein VLA88_02950 [Candidatus Saccharimonadales bacterium]|nr:hypothetical protein [Candidatus Saccharimonadales bacterium]
MGYRVQEAILQIMEGKPGQELDFDVWARRTSALRTSGLAGNDDWDDPVDAIVLVDGKQHPGELHLLQGQGAMIWVVAIGNEGPFVSLKGRQARPFAIACAIQSLNNSWSVPPRMLVSDDNFAEAADWDDSWLHVPVEALMVGLLVQHGIIPQIDWNKVDTHEDKTPNN